MPSPLNPGPGRFNLLPLGRAKLAMLVNSTNALGLVARFTIVGLIVGLLVAAGLASFIDAQMSDVLLVDVAARAADQVDQLALTGYVSAEDFAAPHTPERLESISARLDPLSTHLHQAGPGLIRLQVFADDGTILYSDLLAKQGQQVDLDDTEHLADALAGQSEKEVSSLDTPENSELKAIYPEALEVYVPVRLAGQVVGAYEIYQDLAPVRAIRPLVWSAVLGAFAMLLLALFAVVQAGALLIRRQQGTLAHQAFHDALTNLPNRTLFLDRVAHALTRKRQLAVLFLDVDNLKLVNDSLGHAMGDQLLIAFARRLQEVVGPGQTVARLGGDEFCLLIEDVADATAALACAERALAGVREPLPLQGRDLYPTASIGIALSSGETESPQFLLRDADAALFRAKAHGRNRCELFDESMARHATQRLALEADLRHAVERGEMRVYYQPIVDLADDTLVEVEALVRWQHPLHGLIPPLDFIPLAEETGLIVSVGGWVLQEACRQAAAWQRAYPGRAPVMGVNLSARQFLRPELLKDIQHALQATGLAPARLKLEITESVAMQDVESTTSMLAALRKLGVHLAIDDFGTGYSSLAYLKRFPVNTLKIDRSFVDGLGEDLQDEAIVRSVVVLAKALGLSVTGEGVETELQKKRLTFLGCDRAQGFLFARPITAEQLEARLRPSLAASGLRAA